MKKTLLILGSFLTLSSISNGQLSPHDYMMEAAPAHIQQRKNELQLANLAYSMNKSNNSYDTPLTIEDYDVDQWQVETLNKVYEFTYSPSGILRTMTRMNAALVNERRTTYNYTEFGEISSLIYEQWNGFSWDFDYRYIRTYNEGGLLEYSYYDTYNSGWQLDYVERYQYIGGNTTPSIVIASVSDDNIQWQEEIKIYMTYGSGSTPNFLEVVAYDDNYLYWVQAEKWEISNWGPNPFKADRFFNSHEGLNKVTDNLIYKLNGYTLYPADFVYHSGFNYSTGVYDFKAKISSVYNQDDRIKFIINEYNGSSYDSTARYTYYYDNCYGYKGNISEDYVSPGVWTLSGGVNYEGYTTPYANSCYVNAYNYFENFNAVNPNGVRTNRWVINQASSLGLEEELNSSFSIYPNPANDAITIDLNSQDYSNAEYSISSFDGKTLMNSNLDSGNHKVDVNSLPSGTYFLNVTIDGQQTVKKFIKN